MAEWAADPSKCASVASQLRPQLLRRIRQVQAVTVAWMLIEAAVSIQIAWQARSPALGAFGGDSAIELLSAIVVWRGFRQSAERERAEQRAARAAGILLFALAILVAALSMISLLGYNQPHGSVAGIALLAAAAVLMPWLAAEKHRLSRAAGSAALRADAAESALCAYLSLIALAGLAINAIWHIRFADPAAGLAIVPIIVLEGTKAMTKEPCHCLG